MWIHGGDIDNGRTDVDDKQRSGSPSTPTTDDKVFSADALIREDRNLNWADTARMLGFSPSSVQIKAITGKCVCVCVCVCAQAD